MARSTSIGALLSAALLTLAPSAQASTDREPRGEPLLLIVPLGRASPDLVALVAKAARERFRFRVEIAPAMAMPSEAWYAPRSRWRAEKILDALDRAAPSEAWRVAAITEEPISTTKGAIADWGIAGLGSLGGKSSVFTSHLFRRHAARERARYVREMENLVLHEIGHTLGLDHCILDRCLMADAKGDAIRAAARSINELCPACYRRVRAHLRAEDLAGEWSEDEIAQLVAAGRIDRATSEALVHPSLTAK